MSSGPGPIVLIDTSTDLGSVGIGRGSEVIAYRLPLVGREQASGLIPCLAAVLDEAGLGRSGLSGVVVGRGPGSFTGVRVAVATARGLAKGLGVPLWHHSSLAAGAASFEASLPPLPGATPPWGEAAGDEETRLRPRYVLFDARADRVYAACYAFAPGVMETIVAPRAATVAELLTSPLPREVLFCGSGALRHSDAITGAGYSVLPYPAGLPTPHGLLRIHALQAAAFPAGAGGRWEPDYLRGGAVRASPVVAESTK